MISRCLNYGLGRVVDHLIVSRIFNISYEIERPTAERIYHNFRILFDVF